MKRNRKAWALIGLLWCAVPGQAGRAPDVQASEQTVRVGNQSYLCKVVRINLSAGTVVPRVLTARDGIGRTEEFGTMVKRSRAVAAINGSFFAAYNQTGDKDPDMTLITRGTVIHRGRIGTTIGFGPKGVAMGRLDLPIRGTIETPGRRAAAWYAYWINRTPTSPDNITLFTPARGARERVSDGVSVVVEDDRVTRIVQGDTAIPARGFVIHFRGSLTSQADKFPVGSTVRYQVARNADRQGDIWAEVTEAVGAGPRLVYDGFVAYAPDEEGFHDPKIMTGSGRRSALGLTKDGSLLLVVVNGATIGQLAQVMQKLGAWQAMNLDGGASSGLYANGITLTNPGRPLSNVLAFVRP